MRVSAVSAAPASAPTVVLEDLRQTLVAEPALDGRTLAGLFGRVLDPTRPHPDLRNTLQLGLVERTLVEARANVGWYQAPEYGEWRGPGEIGPPDLRSLPVLDRATVAANHDRFVDAAAVLGTMVHTSGTTGTPLEVYRSQPELRFLGDYFRSLALPPTGLKPLHLFFPNFYHGSGVPIPSPAMRLASGVTDDTLIQDAAAILLREHRLPGCESRVSALSGLTFHVLFFTSYLLEQGVNLRATGVRTIAVTGNYTARHWRRFLADAWGVPVIDRFSLTESMGGAPRFLDSDRFVLDPFVVGECLDPDTLDPLQAGVGRLALTNLYPFTQMMPLLRYTTGDLVRRVATSDPGEFVFEHLGKEKNCLSLLRDGRREWLLFSTCLNEILSALPDIRIYDWFANVRVAFDRTVGSLPIMVLRQEERDGVLHLTMKLELRYAPHLFGSRLRELEQTIVQGLRAVPGTTLARRLDDGSVSLRLQFFAPGQLNEPIVIKI